MGKSQIVDRLYHKMSIFAKIRRMKKILLVFGLFFLIGLFNPNKALAGCSIGSTVRGCTLAGATIGCLNGGTLFCCDSQPSCDTLKAGGQPAGINNSKKEDPTVGCTNGINTAIGCIPVLNSDNGTAFAGFILRWGIGVGSGIAFLLIVYGGFMVMTSAGDPNRLKAGQELLTSAISGLILLIFSIFVLKFVGIDILGLGAWGFGK